MWSRFGYVLILGKIALFVKAVCLILTRIRHPVLIGLYTYQTITIYIIPYINWTGPYLDFLKAKSPVISQHSFSVKYLCVASAIKILNCCLQQVAYHNCTAVRPNCVNWTVQTKTNTQQEWKLCLLVYAYVINSIIYIAQQSRYHSSFFACSVI